MIIVESKRKGHKTLQKLYPNAELIDVTSRGTEPFVKLSPFYPHGNIPVPFSDNYFASSVEGIWQGLKVFRDHDIDISKFEIINMKGIKRTARKFGQPLGHKKGVNGTELLDYLTARKKIYLPSYAWVLQNKLICEVDRLIGIASEMNLVLLDFETNEDIKNISKPLSHAGLIKKFIYKTHPELQELSFSHKISTEQKNDQCEVILTKPRQSKKNASLVDKNQLSLDL